jgi:hypothetical protein
MPACRKKQNIHDDGGLQTSAERCPLSSGSTYPDDSEEAAPQGKEVEGEESQDKEAQKPQGPDPSEAAGQEENGALPAHRPACLQRSRTLAELLYNAGPNRVP